MRKILLLCYTAISVFTSTFAQTTIHGLVVDEKSTPVYGANIFVKSENIGTSTNFNGEFSLSLNSRTGYVKLEISFIGYKKSEVSLELPQQKIIEVTIEPDYIRFGDVVVSESRKNTYLKNSPVKIEVIPQREIDRFFGTTLTEVCEFTPGLKVQNNCGVCGTTDIRIQGLEGQYTQMLINGFPVVSSLGTVYGLMGINSSNIKQIEIVKGPGSILYGPEALAGTINVILKKPTELPALLINGSISDYHKTMFSISGTKRWNNIASSATIDYSQNKKRVDINNDGFTSTPLFERISFVNQWMGNFKNHTVFLFGRYYYEDRFGGEKNWERKLHRGGDIVYGESIFTNRFELLGGINKKINDDLSGNVNISFITHNQDSYYGTTYYLGKQNVFYSDAILHSKIKNNFTLSIGAAFRIENYDDNTPATADPVDPDINKPVEYTIGSLFAQGDLILTDQINLLLGMRYNHHNIHGTVLHPRFSLKFDPGKHTSFRLSAGTGFRNVNIFTEEHSALSGAREVVIAENLMPERSVNITSTIVQDIDLNNQFARIEVSTHYTKFSNKIIPDYETDPDKIIYANLDGFSLSRGISAVFEYQFNFPMRLKLGYDFLDTFKNEDGERTEIEFNPRHSLFILFDYSVKSISTDINISGKIIGRQKMPYIPPPFERPVYSPVYSLWDIKFTYSTGRLKLFTGANNVFNYTQNSPLIDSLNPFGDDFDTIYIYGPLLGRELIAGFEFEI